LYLVSINTYACDWETLVFGNWQITRVIPTNGFSALSQDEAEAFIDSQLSYTKLDVNYNQILCKSPSFKTVKMSEDQFFDRFSPTFSELGISKNFTYSIVVDCLDENVDWLIGSFLYTEDIDHLILTFDGAFFELERAKK